VPLGRDHAARHVKRPGHPYRTACAFTPNADDPVFGRSSFGAFTPDCEIVAGKTQLFYLGAQHQPNRIVGQLAEITQACPVALLLCIRVVRQYKTGHADQPIVHLLFFGIRHSGKCRNARHRVL
jgi:hypothetical protein